MTGSRTSLPRHVAPTQVWAHVPSELQQRTIRLLAKLAFNWVVAYTTGRSPSPAPLEAPHEDPHGRIQAPADAS